MSRLFLKPHTRSDAVTASVESEHESGYKLLGDEPSCSEVDPLGFAQIADQLVDLMLRARTSSPFTLGIEGGWGTGKSSLMARIQRRLDDRHDGIRTVWFNGWAVDEGEALEGLVKSVLATLGSHPLRAAALNRKLMGWTKIVATLVGAWFGIGGLVDSMWSAVAADPSARGDLKGLVTDAMEVWLKKEPPPQEGRLLVVFIDDLDRCSPASVFQIFEAVKLHLSTVGLVFVIGYDKQIVSDAILKEKHYSDAIKGTDYLDKIIQVSYRMPRPSDDTADTLITSYLTESRTLDLFSETALKHLVVERNARNPRRIKRFINAFILEWGLDPEWAVQGFDPGVAVRVVILYLYFPEFAALLEAPTDHDPIEQFEQYVEVRRALRQGAGPDDPGAFAIVRTFIATYGLPQLASNSAVDPVVALKSLDDEMPGFFPQLARQPAFIQLVKGLGGRDDRNRLRVKLQRRRPTLDIPAETVASAHRPPGGRRDVKTLTDSLASQVNLTPQIATVRELGALPAPTQPTTRVAAESRTYQVTGTITHAKQQVTGDISMVLVDSAGDTMPVRCVLPQWSVESPVYEQLVAVREAVEAQFPAVTSGHVERASVPVAITGVGFFDVRHGQLGMAPNGFELRPILSFEPGVP